MRKFLIVNADDFGLCDEISGGIIKAFKNGIVTSTTVVTVGTGFESGLPLLKDSGIDTGIHLTFVGNEKPLTGNIDGLVDCNGFFPSDYSKVVPKILLGKYDWRALKKELTAQVEKLKDSGFSVTHMDSHQHLHILPGIKDILVHIARRFNIKWIRMPSSQKLNMKGTGLNFFSSILKYRIKNEGFSHADRFDGFDFSGSADETNVSAVLKGLRPGLTELMVHPGHNASSVYEWPFKWEEELAALTSEKTKKILKENDITLTDYGKLQ